MIGVSVLVAPRLTAQTFLLDVGQGGGVFATQIVGGRDLALGGLLLDARKRLLDPRLSADKALAARDNLRRALWAGIVVDSIDVGCCLLGEMTGTISWEAAGVFGAGAAAFIGMAVLALRAL
jgi:hypothetical protein